jgi:hypothetical protein
MINKGERLYEYQTPDGKVFWSYERFPNIITNNLRLILQSTVGQHINNFLHSVRLRGVEIQQAEIEAEDLET